MSEEIKRYTLEELRQMKDRGEFHDSGGAPEPLEFGYTNHRGEYSIRQVMPTGPLYWGVTEWHPEPQWLLPALDLDKDAERDFAVKDIGFQHHLSTEVEGALDPVALEQAIASAEQRLLTAVNANDRGWHRLDHDGWVERISGAFQRIRSFVPRLVDHAVEHQRWMENRYYRRGFEMHGEGLSRDRSPYIAGYWTDQWQMGWDYAERASAAIAAEESGQ